MKDKKIILKKGKSQSLLRYHPWVFSGAIQKIEGDIHDGDWVKVFSYDEKWLGSGFFQKSGSISIRIYDFLNEEQQPGEIFQKKIGEAVALRKLLGLPSDETNAFRLIHGEGDGCPGLIVDVYDHVVVLQSHINGPDRYINEITDAIFSNLPFVHTVVHQHLPADPSSRAKIVKGEHPDKVPVRENGLKFFVDPVDGQKTGFFIDQRNNRQLVREMSKNRKVLNAFSYTGAFTVAALAGGASLVDSVDISKAALQLVKENIAVNHFEMKGQIIEADVMDWLKEIPESFYDLIILDPPAFAKNHKARHQAYVAYKRINAIALKKLMTGGLLFTFSCSQAISNAMFEDILRAAAIEAKTPAVILKRLHQSSDHPVNIFHPEGSYLKGLLIYKKPFS